MKKYNLVISIFSLLGIVVGYVIASPYQVGLCELHDFKCFDKFPSDSFGSPLLFASISIFIISLIIYFVREEVFRSLHRFAKWYILISFFLVLITPATIIEHNALDPIPALDKGTVTLFLSVLFFLISLLIISIKSWKLRRG